MASSHRHSLSSTDNSGISRIPGPIESWEPVWSQVWGSRALLLCHWSPAANTGLWLAGSRQCCLLPGLWLADAVITWSGELLMASHCSHWHDSYERRKQEIEIILKRAGQRMSSIFLRDEQNLFRLRGSILTQPVSKPTSYYNEAQNNAS